MDKQQFKSKLTGVITSAKNQRQSIQELIVAGIEQYSECGRTTYLSELLARTVEVKSLPTVTIKDFIKEHTDLKYAKNTAGEYMFLRADKNADKKAIVPTINWYDWNKGKHNQVKEVDYKKRLTNDVKKAREHGLSSSDMLEALLAGGLTSKELMSALNKIDNLQLKAIAA